ncbi:MAG: RNA polymerase II transcription factor B subunit 1 [Caeruleum heppii]|nr:MAG: RNA polymerase II transcription factor B subunit 1 [Caeruleum heppii]
MPPPRASAALKKKDGTMALTKDLRTLTWTPIAPPGAPAALTIRIGAITNLQQTPASSAKVMLKVFTQQTDISSAETHIFTFTSPTAARVEADTIRDALSKSIQAAKTPSAAGTPAPAGGASAAMAIASSVASLPPGRGDWYDDAKLKSDVELQQSLLKSDPPLQKTFMESLRTKPETISNSQFMDQFWSSRLHLLRAHAIEKNQTKGAYNVLSTIKTKTEDSVTKLSISKEQIQLIFNQHPLVKRVYDENVPRLDESTFWVKFFQSRLFKKIKGERILESDPLDPLLDIYLRLEDETERSKRMLSAHIPHTIDLEGNEENHSQRKGNQPDLTMRPTSVDKVPIIRSLNNLSERLMAQVAPADVDPSEPIGMDEETFNELRLRDLQGDAKERHVILNIRDPKHFFSDERDDSVAVDAALHAQQVPQQGLQDVLSEFEPTMKSARSAGGLKLELAIGVDEESSSDEEDEDGGDGVGTAASQQQRVGSRSAVSAAKTQIMSAIIQQRSQTDDVSSPGFTSTHTSRQGLSSEIFDRLTLTHTTTIEFLAHFWTVFLSGDGDRATELSRLAESLARSLDRIEAVLNDAEKEREALVETKRREVREIWEKTGRKVRVRGDEVSGGGKVVRGLLGPTIAAVNKAKAEYEKALRAEGIENAIAV